MASIQKRNGKFILIYYYKTDEGKKKQKWETYQTRQEAEKRKREVEYKSEEGLFLATQCTIMTDLLEEYVSLYGREKWALSTYDSNVSLINN